MRFRIPGLEFGSQDDAQGDDRHEQLALFAPGRRRIAPDPES
jgi:hypothetical protein